MAYSVILTTAGDRDSAVMIARTLVGERLVACVNMILGVQSFYWWEGKVDEDREFLLLCKTRQELIPQVEAKLKEIHPYDVPEIIQLPIEWGSKEYLAWIAGETRAD